MQIVSILYAHTYKFNMRIENYFFAKQAISIACYLITMIEIAVMIWYNCCFVCNIFNSTALPARGIIVFMPNTPWYIAGLHFECLQCGSCCSGPGEGYVWLCDEEIKLIAEKLKLENEEFRKNYTRRACGNISLNEDKETKDCIFLGKEGCTIYKVRPNQCRTWPFWDSNLDSIDSWNYAAQRCPGINRGRLFNYEEIETIRKSRNWWNDRQAKDL